MMADHLEGAWVRERIRAPDLNPTMPFVDGLSATGDKAFGTDVPGGFPSFQQCLLDLWPIAGQAAALDRALAICVLIEQSNGILARVPSYCYHRVKQQRLLGRRSLLIAWSHPLDQPFDGRHTSRMGQSATTWDASPSP